MVINANSREFECIRLLIYSRFFLFPLSRLFSRNVLQNSAIQLQSGSSINRKAN